MCTKIIIRYFFVAPSMLKSKPAAITGARMDSCLEMPKAVSVSCGTHLLNLLQSDKRNEKMSALLCKEVNQQMHNVKMEMFVGCLLSWR